MAADNQVVYRDAFLGAIQTSARVLERIRFPLVITLNRSSTTTFLSAFKNLLQTIYCDRGQIHIVAQSNNKMMIMFSDDQDAVIAYEDLHNRSIDDHLGPIVTFKIWHPMDDLGYDIADHHIYVSIEGLPLHLWKKEIVDQIIHPYCALEELTEETSKRRNLSSYTAFAWSQKRITMPKKISLKVIKQQSVGSSISTKEVSTKVNVYTLMVQVVGYLCDETTNCSCNLENLNIRYEDTYNPDNAQCFLSVIPDNKDLLDELQFGVVARTTYEDHGYQKEEMQEMVSNLLGCSMKVHRLSAREFIILSSDGANAAVAQEILIGMKCFELPAIRFSLSKWQTTSNSIVEDLPLKITVTMTEIPAHRCTPKVMRFILSPYCAMEDDDECAQTITTSEQFTCTAWTTTPLSIPTRIMAALFTKSTDEQVMDEDFTSADLRITQLLIDATITRNMSNVEGQQAEASEQELI